MTPGDGTMQHAPGPALSAEEHELVELLLAEEGLEAHPTATRIPRRESGAPVPLSYAQEVLWLLERANPQMHAYNVPRSLRLHGPLDEGALQRALDQLVARHEALRTTLEVVNGEPRQIVHAPRAVPVHRMDLQHVPAAERETIALRHIDELTRRSFDLGRDLQLRVSLLTLERDDHVLLLESHHVASDGWSRKVLARELQQLYAAERGGRSASLPELPVQYADFAVWQRETLRGERLEQSLEYWRTHLAGAPLLLEVPTDRPRSAAPRFDGATRRRTIPLATLQRLRAFSRAHDVTPFMVLLAVFDAVLARASGQDDLVIGTPIAGRSHEELSGVIGFFANTLVLRTRVHGDPTFLELVHRVRDVCLGAFEHQQVPFEKLVMELQRDRTIGRASIVQVVFAFQDAEPRTFSLGEVSVTPFAQDRGAAKFELSLFAQERADGLRLALQYRTDLYDDATIDRLLEHFAVVLEGALDEPQTPVSRLPVMSAAEHALVVRQWNETAREYPRTSTVHALFSAQAARTPDTIAATLGAQRLSYRELDVASLALAHRLRAEGAGGEALVGLCVERSLEMLTGILAILKAGSGYVPLDPEYPTDRLAFMLIDTRAPVILAHAHLEPRLRAAIDAAIAADPSFIAPRVVRLDTGQPADVAGGPLADVATAESVAYVMFTSGSTGRPKGVLVPHRAIVRLVRNPDYVRLGPEDTTFAFAPISFDASTFEIWGALLNGGRVAICPPGFPSLVELGDLIATAGVTTLWLTSALFQQVVDAGLAPLRGVRQLLAGGDVLSVPHVRRVLEELPGCRLINGYGPTENTTFTCCFGIPREWPADRPLPIGRPIANTRVYILDGQGQPVPIGIPGELYAAGDGVAAGYLRRPELTAERFVPDPFATEPGARMYRTGDRVRWLADGTIEFLGRFDTQVKIRGFRVEPGEVEAMLGLHPSVQEGAVIAHRYAPGDTRLVGYYVPREGATLAPSELRAWLRERLPDHLVPSVLVPLATLPVSPTGKVDRAALPSPEAAGVEDARPYAPPRTTLEHELVQIWEKLLAKHPIGIDEDFFDIGGHSLLATQMLYEIERVRGRRLAFASLFSGATIADLAAQLEAAVQESGEPPIIALQEEARGTPFVFLHGDVRGGGWYCRRLAPALGPDTPMIVLPTMRPGHESGATTIPEIAAAHVRALRAVRPRGPYRLGGYCTGGIIAFEMARQLRAAGEEVERLVLVDSSGINARFRWLVPFIEWRARGGTAAERLERRAAALRSARYYWRRLRAVRKLDIAAQWAWLVRNVRRRVPFLSKPLPPLPMQWDVDEDFLARTGTEVLRFQDRAAAAYVPRFYDGALDLIIAADFVPSDVNRARGWDLVCRTVRVHAVPASHVGLITDRLEEFARCLRGCLDGVGAAP